MPKLTDFSNEKPFAAPSMLAADFTRLGEQLRECEAAGVEVLHVDIMDGHFVPNLSFGPGVVESIRPTTSLCLDVHLMISEPSKYVEPFAKAGADNITVHVEVEEDVQAVIGQIHDLGCTAGITLRPGTDAEAIEPYLGSVAMVLVMTVEPGFGGQSFRWEQTEKIRKIRQMIKATGRPIHIEVDGGIAQDTAGACVEAGANVLVAGSSVFRGEGGIEASIRRILSH